MRVDVQRDHLAVDHPLVDAVSVAVHRPSRPWGRAVLLTHGAGGDLDQERLVALADATAARGHVVALANLPWREAGRGRAPRATAAVSGFAAVLAAVREAHGPRRGWVAGGASYGGRVATLAVAAGMIAVDGVVCVGYPLHPPGRDDDLRVEHWPGVSVPVLFLQGTHDAFGGPDELQPHLRRLPRRATVHPVRGADHGLTVAGVRSPDGQRHEAPHVAAGLGGVLVDWLEALEP